MRIRGGVNEILGSASSADEYLRDIIYAVTKELLCTDQAIDLEEAARVNLS